MHSFSKQACLLLAIFILVLPAQINAETFKPEIIDPAFQHDRWKTACGGITRDFAAFLSCFDNHDDDNKDGTADTWGVPEWVSYEMKRLNKTCIKTANRPSKWFGDQELISQGIMPSDNSYAYPKKFIGKKRDWFSRGHLCMKMHGERLGAAQGWNTHTFFNAVPQRQLFNAGIWLDLEYLTAAWAQKYGSVWVIDGPIFADKAASFYIGEAGEMPVAVPDALFKIVIKEGISTQQPDILAFIYPQVGAGYYNGKPYNHLRYITTIDEIEKLTGINFISNLPKAIQKQLKKLQAPALWPVDKKDFLPACQGAGKVNE